MILNIPSKNQIKSMVKEEIEKRLDFIYKLVERLSTKVSDLEGISDNRLKGGEKNGD